ncbi:hypothetical protein AAVH_40695, partial [Aphelenchoides avenae]
MHHDDDEPMDTGHGAPRPTNLVGLGASQTADGADKASPPVSPTNLVGTQSDAPRSQQTPPAAAAQKKSRSASTEGKRKKKRSSSKATAKTTPSVKSRSSEEFTAEDLAAAKQQYTLAQAKAWLNIETTARTDEDFRRELTHFWDNWRDLNKKHDGAQFKAFSTPWKAHKLGSVLNARYLKYVHDVMARERDDRRGLATTAVVRTTTVTSELATSTTSSPPPAAASASVPRSPTEAMDTSTAPEAAAASAPLTPLAQEDLDTFLNAPVDIERAASEAEIAAADFHSGKFDELLDEEAMEAEDPPSQTPSSTNLVGTEGEPGTAATNLVAPSTGNAGEAEENPAELPSPAIRRHRARRAKDDRLLSPVIDARVFKDSAVRLNKDNVVFTPWLDDLTTIHQEFHGFINAFQVPWAYLQPEDYEDLPTWRLRHRLQAVTLQDVLDETRLPNRYALGHTLGVDPSMYRMVTRQTRLTLTNIAQQAYWEPVQGHRLNIVGIGPTGIDLTNFANHVEAYDGQRGAFARLARAAKDSGKCLSHVIGKGQHDPDIDIHHGAQEVLREVGLRKDHPIHLQSFVATYEDLCSWLKKFPNTVVALDYRLIDNLVEAAEKLTTLPATSPLRRHYGPTIGLLEFCKLAPLDNIVVQSAAYNPTGNRLLRQPGDVMAAVATLERATGTSAEVYLERSALNAARLYRLEPELFDRALRTPDTRQQPRCTIRELEAAIRNELTRRGLTPPPPPPPALPTAAPAPVAPAPRADQDQNAAAAPPQNAAAAPQAAVGSQNAVALRSPTDPRRPPAGPPTNLVGDQPGASRNPPGSLSST